MKQNQARGPISVRLSDEAWTWIEREAKKSKRGASTIIRSIVEERAGVDRPKTFIEALHEFREKHKGSLLTDEELDAILPERYGRKRRRS